MAYNPNKKVRLKDLIAFSTQLNALMADLEARTAALEALGEGVRSVANSVIGNIEKGES